MRRHVAASCAALSVTLFYRLGSTELNLQLQPAPSWSLHSTRLLHAARRQELKAL